jgi:hypothetical protein
MAQRRLPTVLADFSRSLQECRQLADDAYLWASPGAGGSRPFISEKRRDHLTETAFLHAFLAWEGFVEESFILYLSGQRPPHGRAPSRYAFPPNHRTAMDWVLPEDGDYTTWTVPSRVSKRAERFFKDGRPFSPVLRSNQSTLDEVRTIRNAIAHKSQSAREKFEKLVRAKLRTLPPKLDVGGFLAKTAPGTTPPISFLEHYFAKIDSAAHQIVPR